MRPWQPCGFYRGSPPKCLSTPPWRRQLPRVHCSQRACGVWYWGLCGFCCCRAKWSPHTGNPPVCFWRRMRSWAFEGSKDGCMLSYIFWPCQGPFFTCIPWDGSCLSPHTLHCYNLWPQLVGGARRCLSQHCPGLSSCSSWVGGGCRCGGVLPNAWQVLCYPVQWTVRSLGLGPNWLRRVI